MTVPAPVARFDDVAAGRSLQFSRVRRVIRADRPDEVRPALSAVQAAVDAGSWAVGMLAYEAAAGLDPDARVHAPQEGLPLVWFGIADGPDEDPPPLTTGEGYELGPWVPDWTAQEHAARVDAVRAAIAEGETYQCNLTTRLRSRFTGDAFGLYGSSRIASAAVITPSWTWAATPWSVRARNRSSPGRATGCAPRR